MDITEDTSLIVAKNVILLRNHSQLTLEGFAVATGISLTYLRRIEKGKANITSGLATKIADLFEIKTNTIFSIKPLKLKNLQKILPLQHFYKENINTPRFFVARKREDSVNEFLRKQLLHSEQLTQKLTVGQIRKLCKNDYKKDFTSKELSRQLNRLVDENLLLKEDKFNNGKIFLFYLKAKGENGL